MCANSKGRLGCDCLGFVYARNWAINEPTII